MVLNLRDIAGQGHEIDRSILTLSRSSLGVKSRYHGRIGCELGVANLPSYTKNIGSIERGAGFVESISSFSRHSKQKDKLALEYSYF